MAFPTKRRLTFIFLFAIALIFLFIFSFLFFRRPGFMPSKENLTTYHIQIPGVQKTYRFLYITDTHILLPEENDGQQIFEYATSRLNTFSQDGVPPSSDQFPGWIRYANTKGFDGFLLGGDIIDSPTLSNLSYLGSTLEKVNIPYLYTLGNHDWTFPWEYMTEGGSVKYLPLLAPYMNNNTSIHSMEYEDFTIVSVDNSSNQINPSVLEEYRKILGKGKPIILMLHIPLYTPSLLKEAAQIWKSGVTLGGGIHGGIYPDDISTQFIALTTAKNSPVAAVLAGHVHFAEKSDIPGEKNIPQITGDAGFKGMGTIIQVVPSNP